jgi:hypothetical protein
VIRSYEEIPPTSLFQGAKIPIPFFSRGDRMCCIKTLTGLNCLLAFHLCGDIKEDFKFGGWHEAVQESEMVLGIGAVVESRNGVTSGVG